MRLVLLGEQLLVARAIEEVQALLQDVVDVGDELLSVPPDVVPGSKQLEGIEGMLAQETLMPGQTDETLGVIVQPCYFFAGSPSLPSLMASLANSRSSSMMPS